MPPALLCGLAADAEAGGEVGPGVARPRLAGSVIAPAMPALSARHGRMSNAPSWSVAARLDNALGRRYELANGYATAGRSASISARYAFH